ncbi:MAG: hypothetical protein HBSIN02_05340 [Bacteroidia bacterium]|nr:MAG: hypothetical protein HBSIN02_05340 [Bacteroidia bacterium]
MRTLAEVVVLRVLEHDGQFRMVIRRPADIRVHLNAPRLTQIALAHANGPGPRRLPMDGTQTQEGKNKEGTHGKSVDGLVD